MTKKNQKYTDCKEVRERLIAFTEQTGCTLVTIAAHTGMEVSVINKAKNGWNRRMLTRNAMRLYNFMDAYLKNPEAYPTFKRFTKKAKGNAITFSMNDNSMKTTNAELKWNEHSEELKRGLSE